MNEYNFASCEIDNRIISDLETEIDIMFVFHL